MEKTANPKVPAASGAAPEPGSEAAAVASTVNTLKAFGLAR